METENKELNFKDYIYIIQSCANEKERETILKGLDELFRFHNIRNDNIMLYHAYLNLREIYKK